MFLSMETASRDSKDVVEARYLVIFAEAIFIVWFRAFTNGIDNSY